jgi:hypothetical protein
VKIAHHIRRGVESKLKEGEEIYDLVWRELPCPLGPPGWVVTIKKEVLGQAVHAAVFWPMTGKPTYDEIQKSMSKFRDMLDKAARKQALGANPGEKQALEARAKKSGLVVP